MLKIKPFTLGPVETNAYLVADSESGQAVVIDPAWNGEMISAEAQRNGWQIGALWLTHAHFDHIAGAAAIARLQTPAPPIALHTGDLALYRNQGGAPMFGLKIEQGPEPSLELTHGQLLQVGGYNFEVRHTPGHTPGHVIFYCPQEKIIFCGDLIFQGSIGRTDLPKSSFAALMNSIETQIMTQPDETRLLSGHGPETTVGIERSDNPFLNNSYLA